MRNHSSQFACGQGTELNALLTFSHLILAIMSGGCYYDTHFTDKETENLRVS